MNLFGPSSDVKAVAADQDGGFELFAKVGEVLQAPGLKVGTGAIVDAIIQWVRRTPPRTLTRPGTQRLL